MNEFKLPNLNEEKSVLKTIRLKLATLKRIEGLSKKNNISVNRLINECIEFALNNLTDKDLKGKEDDD
jgi:predicted DNA-binding protein